MIQQKDKTRLTNWELVTVNPVDKTWNSKDLFCFWANGLQTLIGFSLLSVIFLSLNLQTSVVFASLLVGVFLVSFLSNLIGKPSQQHGVPFPVIMRISHGFLGAKYLSLIRSITGIFMFGVQTFFISKSIGYLIKISLFTYNDQLMNHEFFLIFFMGQNIIDWFSFIVTLIIQYFLFSNGHLFNRKYIIFSSLVVYVGLFIFSLILFVEHGTIIVEKIKNIFSPSNFLFNFNLNSSISLTGTIFAYFSILLLNFGDYSRYVKSEREMKKGNYSLFLNTFIFLIFALIIVIGSEEYFVKNSINTNTLLTNPTDIIGKIDNTFLTIIVLFFIFFASSSTNLIANYIPSQNILINFMPNYFTLKSVSIVILLLSTFIGSMWLPILSQSGFLSLIDTVAAFFGPLFGIIIADYYLIKKQKIVIKDLFASKKGSAYYYSSGWHLKALYSLLVSFIFSASTIWNASFQFLQSFSWLIGAFVAFILYYLLASE